LIRIEFYDYSERGRYAKSAKMGQTNRGQMGYLTFQSFDEYAAAVQHADIRVTLSSRQQTHWALDYLPLGDMSVQWGQDAGPNVVEGSSSAGGLTVFLMRYNADSLIGNGCRMQDGSVMLLEPGAEFCMAAAAANRWASIFVPYAQLTALGVPTKGPNQKHVVLSPTAAGKRLRALVENLGIASREVRDALWQTSAASSKIAQVVGDALGIPKETAITPGRHALSRVEITRSALQILEEQSDEQISVRRLANMISISERTLRTTFEEYFGVGPTRYLKVRTLHQARKLLKRSDPYATSVTEIAVGLGIWELGRFARDYKLLFDEFPSETLRMRRASVESQVAANRSLLSQ
jgi:AraC family ethanolamine operon transcriptional activator